MDSYAVEFSARDIVEIERDPLGFGPARTRRYVDAIIEPCARLDRFPHRGTPVTVSGRVHRRFRHGCDMIYFHVFDDQRRVSIEAVLRAGSDFRRHL